MQKILLRSLHKHHVRAFHRLPWQHQSVAENLSQLSMEGRVKEAIQILRHHPDTALFILSSETYLPLVRSCIKFKAFTEGREIHKLILESGIEPNVILQNNIMIMYSKSGDLELTRQVFDNITERNLFSWTAMISAYSNTGTAAEAFGCYEKMVASGIRADHFLYPLVLKSCAGIRALRNGQRVHGDIIRSGFLWDLVVMNSLIDMYAKCERVADAKRVFNEMVVRDVFTWTAMLVGYVQTGHSREALNFFKEMMNLEVRPCSATLAGILPVFSDMGFLKLGKQIHGLIIGSGIELDKFVGSALVDMYVNCGSLGYAWLVFYRIKERDVVCWNAMIKGCSQMGLFDEAVELLSQMHLYRVNPNKTTWDCIISQCLESGPVQDVLGLLKRLENAGVRPTSKSISALLQIGEGVDDIKWLKELHEYIKRAGCISNNDVASGLIDMYSKFGDIKVAREIFEGIDLKELSSWNSMISCFAHGRHVNEAMELFDSMQKNAVEPDINSWNAVIGGFIESSDFEAALEMFAEMKWSNQKPDQTSFEVILPVIGCLTCSAHGKQLHNMFLRNECGMSKFISTAFINMYGNCGNTDYSIMLFESMAYKDLVSWNAIIAGLAKNGFLDDASKTFRDMELVGMKANIITWTSLISGYVHNGQIDEGLKLFCQLQSNGLKPNSVTVASILPACAQSAFLSHGKAVHGYIIRSGIRCSNDLFVENALIDMFVKCGCMEYAERLFRKLAERDVVSWNTMIQGYAIHGKADAALAFFDQMLTDGIVPDAVTFIGVLSACSHAGLIDEGWKQFNYMNSKYGIVPSGKHYACMVDLLGRGGNFDDVRNFIIQMPLKPTASLWGALLSSCKTHGNVEMAEYAAGYLLELQPENPGNYVLLSNIYASAGRWNDVDQVRKMMVDQGVRKQPACSWIEVRNRVRAFSVENLSQQDVVVINRMLINLAAAMMEEGYIPEREIDGLM